LFGWGFFSGTSFTLSTGVGHNDDSKNNPSLM